MAKTFVFHSDDSLTVTEAVGAQARSWKLRANQVAKHRPMFDAEMSVADKKKCDTIAAQLGRIEAEAAK